MSHIHGNRHALEAVVADGSSAGLDRWWALGDLMATGPDPVDDVFELVRPLRSRTGTSPAKTCESGADAAP
jgi:hypothetical protein